jgi:2-dehydropantoate 2-reductase
LQIGVVGAGAVGCYYGGLLARAGHNVMFIGRRTHVDAINTHGLLLESQNLKGYVPPKRRHTQAPSPRPT